MVLNTLELSILLRELVSKMMNKVLASTGLCFNFFFWSSFPSWYFPQALKDGSKIVLPFWTATLSGIFSNVKLMAR